MNEEQAAAFLGVKPNTLAVWRASGRYDLPFVRIGRLIRYRRADLEAWLEKRAVGSEKGGAA